MDGLLCCRSTTTFTHFIHSHRQLSSSSSSLLVIILRASFVIKEIACWMLNTTAAGAKNCILLFTLVNITIQTASSNQLSLVHNPFSMCNWKCTEWMWKCEYFILDDIRSAREMKKDLFFHHPEFNTQFILFYFYNIFALFHDHAFEFLCSLALYLSILQHIFR
jgi:hypothetical protein